MSSGLSIWQANVLALIWPKNTKNAQPQTVALYLIN